jgi:hypothetical protein
MKEEQVDGAALGLFSSDELRDHFKLSLSVLKKHEQRNPNPDDATREGKNVQISYGEKSNLSSTLKKSVGELKRRKDRLEKRN